MAGDLRFEYYLVVYVDVLGQKDILRRIKAIPTNKEEVEEFHDLVKESVGKVELIRDLFQALFDEYNSLDPDTSLVRPEQQEMFLASQKSNLHLYGLSDAVVAYVPLMGNDENCTAMNGVNAALTATSFLGLHALSQQTPLRAGIDVGIATQIYEKEVYGPALVRAFDLESRLAEYPRYVVGTELLRYLKWVLDQQEISPLGEIAKDMARRCKQMIVQDSDGTYMLDFLGSWVKEAPKEPIKKEMVIEARDFVESQYEKFSKTENHKLAARYYRLMMYFRRRQDTWGI